MLNENIKAIRTSKGLSQAPSLTKRLADGINEGKTLRDYITEYMASAKNDQIHRFAQALGADEAMLRDFMRLRVRTSPPPKHVSSPENSSL